MLTGSIASSMQGQPRSTHDIDLVVALEADQADVLIRDFPPPDFYLSMEGIQAAIRSRTMFNLLDVHGGDKVDFWLLTSDDFDRSRFARRRRQFADVIGLDVNVSSPEDTILAKLRWAELSGGSERQFNDALHVYEVQYSTLDLDYLNGWAVLLGIEPLLSRLQREAEPA